MDIWLSSVKSYCSTVSSSKVSASGKLQLHVSWHRKLKSPHCSLPAGLLPPCHCLLSFLHTTGSCVSYKRWYCRPSLFIRSRLHSSGGLHDIRTKKKSSEIKTQTDKKRKKIWANICLLFSFSLQISWLVWHHQQECTSFQLCASTECPKKKNKDSQTIPRSQIFILTTNFLLCEMTS